MQIRTAIGAATINPELLTAAERLQYDGYLRKEEEKTVLLQLTKDRIPIKEIVSHTAFSRGLVRKVLLELYLPRLDAREPQRLAAVAIAQSPGIPQLPSRRQRVAGRRRRA
jgi:hypothetical protein